MIYALSPRPTYATVPKAHLRHDPPMGGHGLYDLCSVPKAPKAHMVPKAHMLCPQGLPQGPYALSPRPSKASVPKAPKAHMVPKAHMLCPQGLLVM
jgi:hypothetical protein